MFLAACASRGLPNITQDSINPVELSENFMHMLICLSLTELNTRAILI